MEPIHENGLVRHVGVQFSELRHRCLDEIEIGLDVANHRTFSHAWSLCIEEQFYLLPPLGLSVIAFAKVRDRTARVYVGVRALYPSLFLFPLVSIRFVQWIGPSPLPLQQERAGDECTRGRYDTPAPTVPTVKAGWNPGSARSHRSAP
jgi:hypothetical protein